MEAERDTANSEKPWDPVISRIRGGVMIWVVIVHAIYWTNFLPYEFATYKSFMLVEMPIFFFLAGASSVLSSGRDILGYLQNRAARILLPYWGFALIALIECLRASARMGTQYPFTEWVKWFLPYNLPQCDTPYLTWHLWFIRCYLVVVALIPLLRIYREWTRRFDHGALLRWIPIVVLAVCQGWCDFLIRNDRAPGELLPYVLVYAIFVYLGMGWGHKGLELGISPKGWKKPALCLGGMTAFWGISYLLTVRGPYTLDMQVNKFPPNSAFLLYQAGLFCIYPLLVLPIAGFFGKPWLKWLIEPYSKYAYTIYLFHVFVFLGLQSFLQSLGWMNFLNGHMWLALALYIPATVLLSLAVVPTFGFLEEYSRRAFTDKRFLIALGVIAVCIGLGYFLEYYGNIGRELGQYPAYNTFNTIFGSDIPRVIDDLTNAMGNHYRTKVHPLFVLLTNPIGSGLASYMGNAAAAIRMTNIAGASCLILAFLYLLASGTGFIGASLLAVILGFSGTMTVWASVPETFAYGSATLLLIHLLGLGAIRGRNHGSEVWSPNPRQGLLLGISLITLPFAGIPALGVTTTNYLQAVILTMAAGYSLWARFKAKWKGLAFGLIWIVLSVAITLGVSVRLSDMQKSEYPSTIQFYLKEAYDEEPRFMNWDNLKHPGVTFGTLAKVMGLYSLIPPPPDVIPVDEPAGSSSIVFMPEDSEKYDLKSRLALMVWVGLLVAGIISGWRKARLQLLTLVACVGVNAGIHSVYGTNEAFLYTGHNLFLLIGIAGLGIAWARRLPPGPRILVFAATALLAWQTGMASSDLVRRIGLLLSGM